MLWAEFRQKTFSFYPKIFKTKAEFVAEISGKTMHSFSPGYDKSPPKGHGNQIEFLSSDGKSYLWYPGNTHIVQGEWKLEEGIYDQLEEIPNEIQIDFLPKICFRYFTAGKNPVTDIEGPKWQCLSSFYFAIGKEELRDGDLFKLSERDRVPYRLWRQYTSLNNLYLNCTDC